MSDPLSDMFEGVPLPWEVPTKVLGKEMPDQFIVAHSGPPIEDPIAWLSRSRIAYREVPLGPNCYGLFHGEPDVGRCYVELNSETVQRAKANVRHTLWHEIGHAIDYLQEENNEMVFRPRFYSTKHFNILTQYARLIVSLRLKGDFFRGSDDDWIKYANGPEELWAEAVALACTNPGAIEGTTLWPAIQPDLKARNIKVPEAHSDLTRMMMASAEKNMNPINNTYESNQQVSQG